MDNTLNVQKENKRKRFFLTLLFSILLGFLIIFFGSHATSPLYAFYQFGANDFDANYFMYLGMSFENGLTPYVEAFDHKGLFIYTLEAFGMFLGGGGRYGLFAIQVLFMAVNVFLLLECMRMLGYSFLPSFMAPLLLSIIFICFKNGTHTGEWMLPWVTFSLYFFIKAMTSKNDMYFIFGNAFAGLEVAFAFGSRPSEAMWGLAFVVYYFIYYIRKKRNIDLLYNAIASFLCFLLPTLAYLSMAAAGGYLDIMWQSVFTQSFVYVGNHSDSSRWGMRLGSAAVSLLLLALCYPVKKRFGNETSLFFAVLIIITGIVNFMIARFPHYWFSSFTMISLLAPIAIFPNGENSIKWKKAIKGGTIFLSSVSVAMSCLWIGLYYGLDNPPAFASGEMLSTYRANMEVKDNLDSTIGQAPEDDTVLPLDCNAGVMVYLKKTTALRFAANQSWWMDDNVTVRPETLAFLEGEKPTWIVKSNTGIHHYDEETWNYVYSHYEMKASGYYISVYHINA